MTISLDDQLQSIGGDLLGARVALDAEWSEAMEQHNYGEFTDSKKFGKAIQLLAMAQAHIDEARKQLKEVTDAS